MRWTLCRAVLALPPMLLVVSRPGRQVPVVSSAWKATMVQPIPDMDARETAEPVTTNTPRTFPAIRSLADWKRRRKEIRMQVQIAAGLYPMPPRTPLRPHIFGRVERDGYTIEKVYLQTYPGFYLAGNLYRPLTRNDAKRQHKKQARRPGILVAHGHWTEGRMANGPDGSIPARAITFAREGCVAFTYDMVGYNDTRQIDHSFANDREHWLWSISLMGLQTWNSIRALDFLSELPDVDTRRLAITGESGGGSQTMFLCALEDRLAAVAPCVMVSHTMQGGCLCENGPGLRISYSNMELAAMAAPKPQIMVAATGDWTRTMMSVEGPAIQTIYDLYGHPDNLSYVIFNYGHNINKTSREAVDRFFGKWLEHRPDADRLTEPPYTMDPVESLRVFPDGKPLPANAKSAEQLSRYLIRVDRAQLQQDLPENAAQLAGFKKRYLPFWRHVLALSEVQPTRTRARLLDTAAHGDYKEFRLYVGRTGVGDSIPATVFIPGGHGSGEAVVLVDPLGKSAFLDAATGAPDELVTALLRRGIAVLTPDLFLTGERADTAAEKRWNTDQAFFTTYNR
ncbi:MAG TPA: hypothetical protein VGS41_01525, partial [Chthonomonadales bacterium]|nr:hypothetical protein [Chthonomonadales bacterium]